ncbi:MAG: anti-sigma factor [Alicyclobacillus sp.]|nr:anti-sigma factor [Alicyclobacillus sp.]
MTSDGMVLCSLRELHVLDGLTDEERSAFEEHLKICLECQTEVASLMPVMDWLLYDFDAVEPPAGMKSRVLERVFESADTDGRVDEPTVSPIEVDLRNADEAHGRAAFSEARGPHGRRRSLKRRGWARRSWIPAGTVAAVVVAAVLYVGFHPLGKRGTNQQLDTPVGTVTQSVQLTATADFPSSGGDVYILSNGSARRMLMDFTGLKPVKGSQVYQVWLLNKGQPPLSIGVFTPDATGDAVFAGVIPAGVAYDSVGVTLEPQAIDKLPKGPLVLSANI